MNISNNYEVSLNNFKEYAKQAHFNIVAENMDNSSHNGYLCEFLINKHRYTLDFAFFPSLDYISLNIYFGLCVNNYNIDTVNQFCSEVSSNLKIAHISVDYSKMEVCTVIQNSFKSNPITVEEYHQMEETAMFILLSNKEELENIVYDKSYEIEYFENDRLQSFDTNSHVELQDLSDNND